MKPLRKYASATAFRVALEDRLKRLAQEEDIDFQRVRRQAAFDRLLCRLFAKPDAPWLLKGGCAMLSPSPTGTISGRLKPQTEEVPRRDQGMFGTAKRSPGRCWTARARIMNDRLARCAVDFRNAEPIIGILPNLVTSRLASSLDRRVKLASRKKLPSTSIRRWPVNFVVCSFEFTMEPSSRSTLSSH